MLANLVVATGAVVVIAILWLMHDLRRERRTVRAYVDSLRPLPGDPLERALHLATQLGNRHVAPRDPVYLSRAFHVVGATASSVIERGGCCSGLSRLYMLALESLGVRANQITVYHREGHAQHCLVEVHLPDGPACVDPVYGLSYRDLSGRPLGLLDLQRGVRVHCLPTPGACPSGYPRNDYYAFDYTLTRTANWTRSWPRRAAYGVLRLLSHGGVDRMRVPQLFEWPQALLALLLVGLAAFGSGVVALSRAWIS